METNLTDLASIIEKGKLEAQNMYEKPAVVESPVVVSEGKQEVDPSGSQSSETSQSAAKISPEDIKNYVKNTDVSNMISQIASNPNMISDAMTQAMNSLSPDMMEQAKKLATSDMGQKLMSEMTQRGVNPHLLRKEFQHQQKLMRGLVKKGDVQDVLYINSKRQCSVRSIPRNSIRSAVETILKSKDVVELPCSRLAKNEWSNKTVSIWYVNNCKLKNRRTNRLAGFTINSEIIIVVIDPVEGAEDVVVSEAILKRIEQDLE